MVLIIQDRECVSLIFKDIPGLLCQIAFFFLLYLKVLVFIFILFCLVNLGFREQCCFNVMEMDEFVLCDLDAVTLR